MSVREHKHHAPKTVTVAVITVSTTRDEKTDEGGQWIQDRIKENGNTVVFYKVIPDNTDVIRETVIKTIADVKPNLILLTGGTGIGGSDVTVEAIQPLFDKEMSAFSTLFTSLSYDEIGSPALMSRATAGIIDKTAVFCMPGSLNACKLACEKIIFPETGHIAKHTSEK